MLGAQAEPRPPGTLAALVPVGPPVPVCGVGAGRRVIGTVTRKARFPLFPIIALSQPNMISVEKSKHPLAHPFLPFSQYFFFCL